MICLSNFSRLVRNWCPIGDHSYILCQLNTDFPSGYIGLAWTTSTSTQRTTLAAWFHKKITVHRWVSVQILGPGWYPKFVGYWMVIPPNMARETFDPSPDFAGLDIPVPMSCVTRETAASFSLFDQVDQPVVGKAEGVAKRIPGIHWMGIHDSWMVLGSGRICLHNSTYVYMKPIILG